MDTNETPGAAEEAPGDGPEGGAEPAPGDAEAEPGMRRIASYLVRVHLYTPDNGNLVPQTNDDIEGLLKTQLGYTYGPKNVSVKSERLDK